MRMVNPILFLVTVSLVVGCSPIPKKYLRETDPSVTLTTIRRNSDHYQGKLVVLGGVIMEEQQRDGQLWLHVRNRPLDQDFRPQLPPSPDHPESGWYWVVVGNHVTFPASHHHWADMTLVGRVEGFAPGKEPILKMMYVRGWGLQGKHDSVWEDLVDANYLPSIPAGAVGEMGQQ